MFSRKTKIVSLMTLGFLIFAFGVVFGLQKIGVVNIRGLADIIRPQSETGGWQGQYYQLDQNNQNPRLVATRNDGSYIDFEWGSSSPISGINPPNYSIRWTGTAVVPQAGTYTFYARTDDGVRLWVENQKLIDDWKISVGERAGTPVQLQANQTVNIVMDYFNGAYSDAGAHLSWASSTMSKRLVPFGGGTIVNPPQDPTYHTAIRGVVKNSSGAALGGVEIKVLDKTNPASIKTLATTTSNSFFITSGGLRYNYQTSWITLPNNSYNNIFLSATAASLGTTEINLSQSGSIIGNSTSTQGTTTTSYDHVKDIIPGTGSGSQGTTFDLEGLVKFENGDYPQTTNYVTVVCPTSSTAELNACKEKLSNGSKSTYFLAKPANPNYKITDLYNIAQSGSTFSSYKVWVRGVSGMYLDINGDGQMQDNEKSQGNADNFYYVFTISASDIHPADSSHTKPWARKDFTLRAIASGDATILGSVKDSNGNPLPSIKIGAKKNGFSVNNTYNMTAAVFYTAEFTATSDNSGNYKITIPSSDIGNTLGSNFQLCAHVTDVNSSLVPYSCYDVGGELQTINLKHNQSYTFDFRFAKSTFSAAGEIYYKNSDGQNVYITGVDVFVLNENNEEIGKTMSATGLYWPSDGAKIANYAIENISQPTSTQNYEVQIVLPYNYTSKNDERTLSYAFGKAQISNNNGKYIYFLDIEVQKANDIEIEVLDAGNNSPIEGAEVRISDRGCPLFGEVYNNTDSHGVVEFSDSKTLFYLASEGDFRICAPTPIATVQKAGYMTSVTETGPSKLGHRHTILLTRINNSLQGNVIVSVHNGSLSSQEYVSAAKVIVRKVSEPDVDYTSKITNVNGSVTFNLPSGEYIFTANKIGYVSRATTTQQIYISENQTFKIDLGLLISEDIKVKPVYVLDKRTLTPLTPSFVKITNLNNNQSVEFETNSSGIVNYAFSKNSSYEIQGKYLSRTIKYNINSGDSSEYYYLLFNLDSNKIIDSVKINVYDSETGDLIKSGVSIVYIPSSSIGCKYYSNEAINTGVYNLFQDFASSGNDKCVETSSFVSGQTIRLSVRAAKDYWSNDSNWILSTNSNHSIVEINISLRPSSQDEFSGGRKPVVFASGAGLYDESALALQKLVDKSWVTVKEQPDAYSAIDGAVFFANEEGSYRISTIISRTFGSAFFSEPGYFNNKDDLYLQISLEYNLCQANNNKLFKDYGDGLYFLFEEKDRYNASSEYYDSLAKRLSWVRLRSKKVSPLIVAFSRIGIWNAFSFDNDIKECFGIQNAHLILIGSEFADTSFRYSIDIFPTLVHEYGHQTFDYMTANYPQFANEWNKLYESIMDLPKTEQDQVFNLFLDAVIELDPTGLGGHPWDNSNEMFASFFNAYFANHDRLYGAINFWVENNSQAQNIVSYMWQIFSDYVGGIYANDSLVFRPIKKSTVNSGFDFKTISSGKWRVLNYSPLPVGEKMAIQTSITFSEIKGFVYDAANNVADSIKTFIQKSNDALESVLSALGITYNNSSVAGTVKDQNGLAQKILVNIGNKFDLTNESGQYSVSRLPSGNSQAVELYDSTIDKMYHLSNITLGASQHKTGVNLQIVRSLYLFSGQVFDDYIRLSTGSYYPVANGSIVLDGKTIISLDNQGKFSKAITEGLHSIVIKNKDGTALDIVDSGSLGDLSNLVVKSNLASDIRVKNVGIIYPAETCKPIAPQTQTIACPSGQTGTITQTRTSSCPGPTWSDWKESANNCVVIVSKLPVNNTFGTSSGWWSSGSGYAKAWDGNTGTYFNGNSSNGGYAGVDLGANTKKIVTKIKYWPRDKYASRMKGGKFQGSNTSQTGGYVDLYTINDIPAQGKFSDANLNNTKVYRYIRYLSPSGGYTNVAEIELWGIDTGDSINPPAESCTPLPSQTRTQSCPTGQTGSITQARTSTCPGPTWSSWITVSNTCKTPPPSCSPLPKETQIVACPSGQKGTITQTRTSSCPGPTWSAWQTASSTCKTCSWLQKLFGACK